jgi:phosphatidylserine/phosphatidylglycerophosphate/cardiolipin synthase-like enzyme
VTQFLPDLSVPALDALASAIESGRLRPPYAPGDVARYVAGAVGTAAAGAVTGLSESGMEPRHVVTALRMLAAERRETQRLRDRVELVWSGPETTGSTSRDTSVVVRSLFRDARTSVLLANYAFDRPKTDEATAHAKALFAPLAENMDRNPSLGVRFFVNIQRPHPSQPGSEKSDSALLHAFAESLRRDFWPGGRLPEVFYDPRALLPWGEGPRASMHAKCLVVDDEWLLVTSANFTQAAQTRNIEAGVVLKDRIAAGALRRQFESLATTGRLQSLPGI